MFIGSFSVLCLVCSCAYVKPKALSYESFNSNLEHVPDLVNSAQSFSPAKRNPIEMALKEAAKSGRKLQFIRMVRGERYCYYVFRIFGLEDRYAVYAVGDSTRLYTFDYPGEANPQF